MTVHTNEMTRGDARALVSTSVFRNAVPLAVLAGAFLFLLAISQPSIGAQINYGSFMGTSVTYVNVTEDSPTDPVPLFGAPTVTGDSIDFNPVGFDASSMGGGSDITEGQLVFMVQAKTGSRIGNISFSEAGDTTLAGNVTPGSMGTASAVFAQGNLDIHEVDVDGDNVFDPIGINHISVPFSLAFTPSGGTYFLGTDGGGGPIFNTSWSGSALLDIDAILVANGIMLPPGPIDPNGGATKISIDLDNTLVAVSENGTSAAISKKDFGGLSIRTNVPTEPGGNPEIPEPASFALAGLALLGLVISQRHCRRIR